MTENNNTEISELADKISIHILQQEDGFPPLSLKEEQILICSWILNDTDSQKEFSEIVGKANAKILIDNAGTIEEMAKIIMGLQEKPIIMEKVKSFAINYVTNVLLDSMEDLPEMPNMPGEI